MDINEFLVEDYKLKLEYLQSQFDRMWTRFNFFLSIEVALFGFLGWLVFDKATPNASTLPASLGLAVSALWYVIGTQDRFLVTFYRANVNATAKRIAISGKQELQWFEKEHAAMGAETGFTGLTSWYWKRASITRMPAVVSLLLIVIWLIILLWGRYLFARL